ncbi:unnamed protein product [Laminaria digitata]
MAAFNRIARRTMKKSNNVHPPMASTMAAMPWHAIATHGNPWHAMATHGNAMGTHGNAMATHGNSWHSLMLIMQ